MNFILRCYDLSLTDTTSSEDENTEFYDAQCGESSEPSSVSNFAKYNKIGNNKLVKKKVKQKIRDFYVIEQPRTQQRRSGRLGEKYIFFISIDHR